MLKHYVVISYYKRKSTFQGKSNVSYAKKIIYFGFKLKHTRAGSLLLIWRLGGVFGIDVCLVAADRGHSWGSG